VRRKKDRELKMENSVNSWKNPKHANHLEYHMDKKPRTLTARKQPANKYTSISLVWQMGLHRHYKGTPPTHNLATIFGNSRNWSTHTQLPNIQHISLNSAMTLDRRAVYLTASPRRVSTASCGSDSGESTGGHMDQCNPGRPNCS
jgi:hypothetical protein